MQKTYIPEKVVVTFGPHQITGFDEGDFIKVEEMSDGTSSEVGADGHVARTINADRRLKITLTLQQTSASNDYLSAVYDIDQQTGNNVLPIVISDKTGTSKHVSSSAWVVKKPESSFNGKETSSREWVIETCGGTNFVGGN